MLIQIEKFMKKMTKYFNNQLSEEESEQITQTLLANHFDRKLEQRWEQVLKEKYNISPAQKNKSGRISLFWKIGITIAASILLLITLDLGYQFLTKPNYEQLVAHHIAIAQKYDSGNTKKGISLADARTLALDAYNRNDFKSAIEQHERIINSDNGNIEDYFYAGLSYLYSEQPIDAIPKFQKASTMSGKFTSLNSKHIITWYLGLAYINTNQLELGKKELQKLIELNGKGTKKQEAMKLMDSLER